MTALFPWTPTSNAAYSLLRKGVNKFSPSLRNTYPMPFLDGPLPSTQKDLISSASRNDLPNARDLHVEEVNSDPFRYMEDLFDRETQKYIKREMRHTALIDAKFDFKHSKGRLWAELDAKVVVSTREGGFDKGEERIGDHIYFTRTIRGSKDSSSIGFYRKKVGEVDLLGEELINPLLLQQHFGYQNCVIGICRVSQDGRYLAYTLSVEGGDRYICHVRSIDNCSLFHVIRGKNIVSVEFGAEDTFYYTESNDLNRPYRIMMQEIRPGLLPPPVEVYREDDEIFFVDVRKTKDEAFVIFSSDSKLRGNAVVVPASYPTIPIHLKKFFPDGKPVAIADKTHWNWIEHYGNHFIKISSDAGPNHRVMYIRDDEALFHGKGQKSTSLVAGKNVGDPKKEEPGETAQWKELVPYRNDVRITDMDLFDGRLVLFESHFEFERIQHIRIIKCDNGLGKVAHISDIGARDDHDVVLHFPPLSQVTPGINKNFKQDSISFVYSSLIQPPRDCVFSFNTDLTAAQAKRSPPEKLFTQRQSEQFTPWDYMWPYSIYRDVCISVDGTQIPITICHRRDAFVQEATDFEAHPSHPKHCFLYVYGAYGEVPSMHFQLAPYMWMLRRRWVVAFAHVRGGGEEITPNWAEEGRKEKKQHSVQDFIACCEHMVRMGYTSPELMVTGGSSAGCVPIAAAMNLRGCSLFHYALLRSPFLDIIHTMLDPDLPLSIAEREEWGDPLNSPKDLEYLQQYDPYHNINDRVTYPGMMISASMDDDRVPAWNALKYVAKLRHQRRRREVDPVEKPLVLRLRRTGGHTQWTSQIENLCEEIAFLCSQLDLEGPGKTLNDMDMMTHMQNLTSTGAMDHDDQQQVFLKWDNWEREKIDYHVKLHSFEWEPNFRKLKAEKEPFFWVPTDTELSQKRVDEILQAKERDVAEAAKSGAKPGSIGKPVGTNTR